MRNRLALLFALTLLPWAGSWLSAASGPVIVQSRGVDSRVDYAALDRFGPWDDRNYQLTLVDLELLSDNESELNEAVPAFYRVDLRRAYPAMLRVGPVQYPRSALPYFFSQKGGYLVEGRIYRRAFREEGRWVVVLEDGIEAPDEFEEGWNEGFPEILEGEARVTNPSSAAESAIAIKPMDRDIVIAGSNGPGSGQKMHRSTDGGETWSQVSLPLGNTCCDPTVSWSSDGSKAYAATLGGGAAWFYRSGDDGQSWTDLETQTPGDPRRELGSGVDKEYLHVDVHATSPHKDNVYMTWHESNVLKFSRSTDLGDTWDPVTSFSSASDRRGIGSDVTSDAPGNVYYFWPAFNSRKIWVARSTNGGASFEPTLEVASTEGDFDFPIPSMDSRNVFIYVSADTDRTGGSFEGSVYASWTDNNGPDSGNPVNNHARIQVAYSRDGGATWSVTTPHETADVLTVDRWHQWLSVAADGSVHVTFYDTRRDPTRDSVDIFHSVSTDGAQTFGPPQRLTSVQSPSIGGNFQFGDYNGLDVVMGDLIAIFTDNRDEAGGGAQSVDVYAAGTEVGGPLIFADGFESGDLTAWDIPVPGR